MYSIKTNRVFGLDSLRALAISLVLISHCTLLLFPGTTNTLLNGVRAMGAIGVDLFFVLSGYLIGGILLKIIDDDDLKWSKLLRFWKRRWLRTLPNYFLILILNLIIASAIGLYLPKSIFLYGLFLQNFAWDHPNFFTEAWSLSIEEFAYLLLPLFLFIIIIPFGKYRRPLFFYTTILVIALLALFKINYFIKTEVLNYHDWSQSFRKVVVYRMDSIYYGFLAVYCFRKPKIYGQRQRNSLMAIGLIVFLGLHAFIYIGNILPETHLWFYVFVYLTIGVISLALCFPFFIALDGKGRLKKIITFISTRSYAMYLVNYSIILLSMQTCIGELQLTTLGKTLMLFIYLGLTVSFSNILYLYFELPILKFRDRNYPRNR